MATSASEPKFLNKPSVAPSIIQSTMSNMETSYNMTNVSQSIRDLQGAKHFEKTQSVMGPNLSDNSTITPQKLSDEQSNTSNASVQQFSSHHQPSQHRHGKGTKGKLVLTRSRNTKYQIHKSAAVSTPIRLISNAFEQDVCYGAETAAERRLKRKLKAKLKKLRGLPAKGKTVEEEPKLGAADPVVADSKIDVNDPGQDQSQNLGFHRPTFEDRLKARRPKINVWESICEKVRSEKAEMDTILLKIGLPPHNFRKDKSFQLKTYAEPPQLETCYAQDFADYYIFPTLLPAIQSMILFAKRNRVFQCKYCTFNPMDYITEYLYNNNPKHPERLKAPVPLYEIPFAKAWIRKYPRKPYPKWLTMLPDDAARIIQRAVRGWLVRKREDVQEMRQFWKDYQKDIDDEKRRQLELERLARESQVIFSPYYDELTGEHESMHQAIQLVPPTPFLTHSDTCLLCNRFRQFIREQEELRLLRQQEALVLALFAKENNAAASVHDGDGDGPAEH